MSGFSSARKHPILGRTRAHQGVDFAAPTGTPIMAAGNARVAFVGWKGGYGRAVILDHGRGYTTLYGHLSRFGNERVGQRIDPPRRRRDAVVIDEDDEVAGRLRQTEVARQAHVRFG